MTEIQSFLYLLACLDLIHLIFLSVHFFFQLHKKLDCMSHKDKGTSHFNAVSHINLNPKSKGKFRKKTLWLASFLLSARSKLLKLKFAALDLVSDLVKLTLWLSLNEKGKGKGDFHLNSTVREIETSNSIE